MAERRQLLIDATSIRVAHFDLSAFELASALPCEAQVRPRLPTETSHPMSTAKFAEPIPLPNPLGVVVVDSVKLNRRNQPAH